MFGQTGAGAVNLSAVAAGIGGFVINGQCAGDQSGISVSSAGDVNGDGLADLLIGALYSDPAAGSDAGRSYLIFGNTLGVFNASFVDQLGDANANTLSGSGCNTSQLARVDGGSGIDTLKLEGAGLTLNLGAVANQGAATPGSSSRLEGIERIDITGSGNNTLTIGLQDVIDLGAFNSFNNATGWANGTYNLAAGGANGADPERRHQLVIDADAGDVVNLSGWTSAGTVTNNGLTYTVYHQGSFAQLLIDNRATVVPA